MTKLVWLYRNIYLFEIGRAVVDQEGGWRGIQQQNKMEENREESKLYLSEYDNQVVIELQSTMPFQRYRGAYTYDKLPIQFRVLFQSIEEFRIFLTSNGNDQHYKIEEGELFIVVNVAGKMKEFKLPLEPVELTPEMEMRRNIHELEEKVKEKDEVIDKLKEELRRKGRCGQELGQMLEKMSDKVKIKDMEIKRLQMMFKDMDVRGGVIAEEEEKGQQENINTNIIQTGLTEMHQPVKRPAYNRKLREMETYGTKILLKLDQTSKHYSKFKISSNDVQKLHGPTYQLYHREAIPLQGKYFFDIRIILIKNNNIVVGVITEKNKDEQFSFKKMNCVCYNGYDGSVCEQDRQNYVNVKPKQTNKIRTVVDMDIGKIFWYVLGGQLSKMPIGSATIPQSMIKQPLFPYFELYWQNNRVKLNA